MMDGRPECLSGKLEVTISVIVLQPLCATMATKNEETAKRFHQQFVQRSSALGTRTVFDAIKDATAPGQSGYMGGGKSLNAIHPGAVRDAKYLTLLNTL